jgi:hypothetical protein
MEPSELVAQLKESKPPAILCVAFPVLYRTKHIVHAIYGGPGGKPEGIELMKKAVANLPKDAELVVYCGCCPMIRCPNMRPAVRALKEMGFTKIRVLNIANNMHDNWYSKDYPSETGETK